MVPGLGRLQGERNSYPLQYFLSGEFHRQRSLEGYSSWGCKELYMAEPLTLSLFTSKDQTCIIMLQFSLLSLTLTFLSWTFTMQTSCVSNFNLTFTSWRIRTNARLPHSFSRDDERRVYFIEDISRKIIKERKILENLLVESLSFCRLRVLKAL